MSENIQENSQNRKHKEIFNKENFVTAIIEEIDKKCSLEKYMKKIPKLFSLDPSIAKEGLKKFFLQEENREKLNMVRKTMESDTLAINDPYFWAFSHLYKEEERKYMSEIKNCSDISALNTFITSNKEYLTQTWTLETVIRSIREQAKTLGYTYDQYTSLYKTCKNPNFLGAKDIVEYIVVR